MKANVLAALVALAVLVAGCSSSGSDVAVVADSAAASVPAESVNALSAEETVGQLETAWAGFDEEERASFCRRYAIDAAASWRDLQAEYSGLTLSLAGFDSFTGDRCTADGLVVGQASPTPSEDSSDKDPADSETESAEQVESESDSSGSSGMSRAQFAVSARGDAKELLKDATDAEVALEDGGMFRLIGNGLEMSFNLGQLQALDPPKSVAREWNRELNKIDAAIDEYTDAIGGDSETKIQSSIDTIKKACRRLIVIAENVAG